MHTSDSLVVSAIPSCDGTRDSRRQRRYEETMLRAAILYGDRVELHSLISPACTVLNELRATTSEERGKFLGFYADLVGRNSDLDSFVLTAREHHVLLAKNKFSLLTAEEKEALESLDKAARDFVNSVRSDLCSKWVDARWFFELEEKYQSCPNYAGIDVVSDAIEIVAILDCLKSDPDSERLKALQSSLYVAQIAGTLTDDHLLLLDQTSGIGMASLVLNPATFLSKRPPVLAVADLPTFPGFTIDEISYLKNRFACHFKAISTGLITAMRQMKTDPSPEMCDEAAKGLCDALLGNIELTAAIDGDKSISRRSKLYNQKLKNKGRIPEKLSIGYFTTFPHPDPERLFPKSEEFRRRLNKNERYQKWKLSQISEERIRLALYLET